MWWTCHKRLHLEDKHVKTKVLESIKSNIIVAQRFFCIYRMTCILTGDHKFRPECRGQFHHTLESISEKSVSLEEQQPILESEVNSLIVYANILKLRAFKTECNTADILTKGWNAGRLRYLMELFSTHSGTSGIDIII